jgi:very-short-patch-repair endonuclease
MTASTARTPDPDLRRPFTRADAIAAGLDPKLLRGSRFRRIFRGVYVLREVPVSPFMRTQAALVLHPPSAFASHVSAARVYRLPVPDLPDEHVSVTDRADRRSRDGIANHVAAASTHVVTYRGIRVSAPFRMFVELASILSLVDLVVVGDAMVRVFGIRAERLVRECDQSNDRYARAARKAAGLVRDEVDSPMESRLRMLIVLAGLPEPEVNHKIRDELGHVLIRLDLSYPQLRLIVEYDGRQHAEDAAQWHRDLERRETFDDSEWRILVVTAKGIYREPARTVERIRKALVKRGCAGVPRQLSEAWRPYFPGRS